MSTLDVWAFLTLLLSSTCASSLGEPTIFEAPKDVVSVTGEDVLLKCVIENLPPGHHVQWTKDGFAFGYDRTIPGFKKYSIIGEESRGEYNFMIDDATIEDEALYECQVSINRMRAKATVSILVPPKGPVIENAEEDGSINVIANAENTLRCTSLNGKPAGELTWYKDGTEISRNVTHGKTSSDGKLFNGTAELTLWPESDDDGAQYECRMSMDKRFLGTNGIDELDSMVRVELNVQKPPVAYISIQNDEVVEGTDMSAECESFASDPPATSYKWFINGELVNINKHGTMLISKVNKTMNGAVIGCSAVNDVGESEISQSSLTVLYAPILRVAPKDVVSNFTAIVEMSCSWESNPPARISWYKRGYMNEILGEGERLTIDVQDQSAAGTYVCAADASGVKSKSVTARLDVLGPPIIDSLVSVHKSPVGDRTMLNCSLDSTPGISRVTWTWKRRGKAMTLEDSGTLTEGENVKYRGILRQGYFVASLVIEDVQVEDFTDYNCTVENAYGSATMSMTLEEQPKAASAVMVPVIAGAIAGLLVLVAILMLAVFCVRRKRQEKSTTFPPERITIQVDGDEPEKLDNRSDPILTKKLLDNDDEDIREPSPPPSVSSQGGGREQAGEFRTCAHNDDGYHTEEANSWNRNEANQSPSSSPDRNEDQEYPHRGSLTPSIHLAPSPRDFQRTASPYAASDAASEAPHNNGYLRYNMQPQPYPQYPLQYTPDVVDLPPVERTASPLHMYCAPASPALPPNYYQQPLSSSGYRNVVQGYPPPPQRSRTGSNAPSVVSSHRSVTPSPYLLGRATPTSVFMDRGMYHVPITPQPQMHPSSSQSSLDHVSSSVAMSNVGLYENPQISRLNSMASHASRSSEILNKPMTARMATHV